MTIISRFGCDVSNANDIHDEGQLARIKNIELLGSLRPSDVHGRDGAFVRSIHETSRQARSLLGSGEATQ